MNGTLPCTAETTAAPQSMKINKRLVKRMVGEAVAETDGVLGLIGGFGDIFVSDDDPAFGVTLHLTHGHDATAKMRLITEEGRNIPDVINEATCRVVDALQNEAGLYAKDVRLEVVDTMGVGDYLAERYPGDMARI